MKSVKKEKQFVFCRECGRELGTITEFGQCFQIRGSYLTVWQSSRFICQCNKPYSFVAADPLDDEPIEKKK
jgi:hypothetical protein